MNTNRISKEKYKTLKNKYSNIAKNIFFLELKKDLILKNGIQVSKEVPIPVLDSSFASEISLGRYDESIPFKNITDGMIFILGCDDDFKFNKHYIDILKSVENIESYILKLSDEYRKSGELLKSLVCVNALLKISDKHEESIFNHAQILRELSLTAKEKGIENEYKLFYELSYFEYSKLVLDYPVFPYSYYHIGFYDFNEEKYGEALKHWEKAYELINENELREEIAGLMESAREKLIFENGRKRIMDGDTSNGLKILLPLLERHGGWSQVRYYAALGYRKSGNYIKAQILLNELLEAGEDFSEIYNELGLCYFNLGYMEKSVQHFEKAVSMKCEPGYLCNLGIAYYNSRDAQKAKETIERAYKMDPGDEVTIKCREWINKE